MDHRESDALRAARTRRGELYGALLDLERSLAGTARGRAQAWADSVRATLIRVRETFAAHVDVTEGPTGLYQEVLGQVPRLSRTVNRLEHEHADIADAIAEVGNRLDDPMSDADAWVESIRDAATTLMGLLVRHRQRGADLVYEAYQVEIGGET